MELQEVQGLGKSSVCNKMKNFLKAEIIDADEIAKKLTSEKSEYLLEIVKLFGKGILNENGSLNRKSLANIIYNDFKAKEELDKITFIFVCKKIEDEIEMLKQTHNIDYVLIDAPLLLEAGLEKICDYVISVIADKKIKVDRICVRDSIDIETANKRLNIQKSDDYYISNSDFVIRNNSEDDLDNEVKEICNNIGGLKNY